MFHYVAIAWNIIPSGDINVMGYYIQVYCRLEDK